MKSSLGKDMKIKTVGILGGLGPEASNKFCEYLIRCKHAEKDQDNMNFIHYCNAKIPSRIDYISGKSEISPIPEMVQTCKALESIGVDCIVVPCNTVHCILPEVQAQISTPIIDIIQLLVKQIKSENPNIKKIGVLGTTLTMDLKLYEEYFSIEDVEVVKIDRDSQDELVMDAIYQIKAGKKIIPRKMLMEAANMMIKQGAEAIVYGCTEIPLVLNSKHFDIPTYEPMNNCAKKLAQNIEAWEKEEALESISTPEEIVVLKNNIFKQTEGVRIFSEDNQPIGKINIAGSINA